MNCSFEVCLRDIREVLLLRYAQRAEYMSFVRLNRNLDAF